MFKKFKNKTNDRICNITYIFELIMALFIIAAITISLITASDALIDLYRHTGNDAAFRNFLETIFDLVIGIEFVKMLSKHNLGSVIEVLLFAIARQMIVEHMNIYESLAGVIAIGLLFAIRKFLYIHELNQANS